MRKALLITCSLFILPYFTLFSQSWSTVGKGVNGPIYAMAVYDSALYVGGNFDSAGGIPANNIAKWDGKHWSAVGTGVSYKYGSQVYYSDVAAMCVFNGLLYVGGYFNIAGSNTVQGLATYNGSTWMGNSGDWNSPKGGTISSMVTNDTVMYIACGYRTVPVGGPSGEAAHFFYDIGPPCDGNGARCSVLAFYNGSIAIAGSYLSLNYNMFTSGYSQTDTALWLFNGNHGTVLSINNSVTALMSDSNELYAGIDNTVSVYNPINLWTQIGASLSGPQGSYIGAFCKYNGNLIAGGQFEGAGTVNANNIMELNGGNWAPMGSGIKCDSILVNGYPEASYVNAMAVFNDTLYVAGLFDNAGGLQANNIARWKGDSVSGVQQVSEPVVNTAVFPNPNNGILFCTVQNNMPDCRITVFNMLGQQINDVALNSGKTEVNIQGQASGIYLYRILSESGGILSSGKFIKL